MKVTTQSFQALLLASASISHLVQSFVVPTPFSAGTPKTKCFMSNGEFDYLLNEGSGSLNYQQEKQQQNSGRISRRNIVCLPESSEAATLVSSAAAPVDEYNFGGPSSSADPFEDNSYEESDFGVGEQGIVDGPPAPKKVDHAEEYLRRKQARAVKTQPSDSKGGLSQKLGNMVKGKDFSDLVFTVFIPLTAGYWVLKQVFDKASDNVAQTAEQTLEDYANEMVFHDGDFEEMRLCHNDYSKKKLVWLGPKKKDAMMKRYLEIYAKKKTVSPQAISSLSYVFSLYKFSEEKAADVLVELCKSMPEKVSSAGKLLFFGTHILKSKEARANLDPIKEMLASSYRDDVSVSGEEIVARSQIAMGEAAYRATVAAGGKKQETLTVGWEVLGLDKEKATEIFDEVAHDGFKSSREQKYGNANQKYDKKGRKIDKEGNLMNPEEATDDDDDDDDNDIPTGSVYECGECGYTLFIAQGRDFKFFSDSFECPECGAKKDKFIGRE